VLEIRTYGDPVLRRRSRSVAQIDESVHQLARELTETMYEGHGVGLAAPQVGRLQRVIVVDTSLGEDQDHPMLLVNPRIVEAEGEEAMEEGCLSVPDVFESVARAAKVTVEYQDLNGQVKRLQCDGLLARVFQHETDHLDGILFIDRVSLLKRQLLRNKLKELAQQSGPRLPESKGKVVI